MLNFPLARWYCKRSIVVGNIGAFPRSLSRVSDGRDCAPALIVGSRRFGTIVPATRALDAPSPDSVYEHVQALIGKHTARYDEQCLILEGATSLANPRISKLRGSSLGIRPSLGLPGAKHETGLADCDRIETLAADLLQELFQVRHAEVRALSGCQAVQIALTALTGCRGATIWSLPGKAGGHVSHHVTGVAGLMGLHVREIPVDGFCIDLGKLQADLAEAQRQGSPPAALLVGSSLPLRSFPLRELRAIADGVSAKLILDGAHVTGMIAGGVFQDIAELKHAHAVTSSSYKSFGGPAGGFVLTDDAEVFENLQCAVFPGLTANMDLGRLPGLCVATADLLTFGKDYAQQSFANANALGESLVKCGIDVFEPGPRSQSSVVSGKYSDSHLIAVDARNFGRGSRAAEVLEEVNILASPFDLPFVGGLTSVESGDSRGYCSGGASALRLGVQELTRRGMKEVDMEEVARLISDSLLGTRATSDIRADVVSMRQRFHALYFVHQ